MSKLLLVLVLLLVFTPSVILQQHSQVIDAKSNVFSITENGLSICTGFLIKGNPTQLLTAGHCSSESTPETSWAAFNSETGQRFPLKLVHAVSKWPSEDYSLFSFTDDIPAGGLTTTRNIPELGDAVWTIEGPLGLAPILAQGVYAGRARVADEPANKVTGMYVINLPSAPGSSGSPVFNSQGQVWGILVGGDPHMQGFALAVLITN